VIEWLTGDGPKSTVRILALFISPAWIIEIIIAAIGKRVAAPGYVRIRVGIRNGAGWDAYVKSWVADVQHWLLLYIVAILGLLLLLAIAVAFAQNRDTRPLDATVRIPTASDNSPQP
jgi:hypothetical protein